MSGAESIIKVIVTGDAKGLHSATDSALKDVQKTGKSSSAMGKQIAGGFAIGAGAAIAFGVQAVEAADVADKAHVRLQTAITNTGGTWKKYGDQIKAADNQGQQFGYDEGQIEGVLASMTTGLGSTKKALDLLPLAQNVAAQTGMDLASAGLLVVKASEGQTKSLKKLGIDLPVAAGGAVKLKNAQKQLADAEDGLKLVEEKIHDGRLKGPAAADALKAANDRLHTAQQNVDNAQSAGVLLTDALTSKYKGAAGKEADTFAGKVAAQAAAWRNVKIQSGQAIEGGLIKFQTWSQKSGRPEIMRLQGALNQIGTSFATIYGAELGALAGLDTFAAHAKPLLALGANLTDAWENVFGGGPGAGTPGAAQRDRARLDEANRLKQNKANPPPATPKNRPHTNVSITVNVHGADPVAVTNAITKQARRNGARVK